MRCDCSRCPLLPPSLSFPPLSHFLCPYFFLSPPPPSAFCPAPPLPPFLPLLSCTLINEIWTLRFSSPADPGRLPKGEKGEEAGHGFLFWQGEMLCVQYCMLLLQSSDGMTDSAAAGRVGVSTVQRLEERTKVHLSSPQERPLLRLATEVLKKSSM